jgi:hypothetical protein
MIFVEKEMIIRKSGAGRIFVYPEIHAIVLVIMHVGERIV